MARAGDAHSGENAPHRGPAQLYALPLPEQLGEVGVVGALVALCCQLHHRSGLGGQSGVVGTAAAVSVSECGGTFLR